MGGDASIETVEQDLQDDILAAMAHMRDRALETGFMVDYRVKGEASARIAELIEGRTGESLPWHFAACLNLILDDFLRCVKSRTENMIRVLGGVEGDMEFIMNLGREVGGEPWEMRRPWSGHHYGCVIELIRMTKGDGMSRCIGEGAACGMQEWDRAHPAGGMSAH